MKTTLSLISMTMLVLQACDATTYCTFYDDDACSTNPSVDFSVDNPGCVQVTKNSFNCHGTNVQNVDMIATNNADCSCQFDVQPHLLDGSGILFSYAAGCIKLDDFGIGPALGVQSYRFVGSVASEPDGGCNTCNFAPPSRCKKAGTCAEDCAT